jgi:UDP-N-acetylmuramoyl-tripeptide--D-alanyl-D-alanine ligase
MPTFTPEQLAAWTGGRWTAEPCARLEGFTIDTRQLRAGQVFVAIKTEKRDGHDFLGAAEKAGASAAIVAKANEMLGLPQLVVADPLKAFQAIAREHRRTFKGPVIGVSGSAGKTSTKNLLALLLGEAGGEVLATEGNLNNHLGVPLTLTRLEPERHRFAVIEAGIGGPGEMEPLAQMIEPEVALITLVAAAHTAELGGLAGVATEKAKLPAAVKAAGVAIFPRQCAEFAAFRELDVRQMVVERADVLRPAEPPKDRVFFTLTQRGDSTAVALAYGAPPPLVFTFRRVTDGMAQNAALAICAALWLGVSKERIQERLQRWEPAKLRGELRRENGRLLYLDCYNANPASMADALETFYDVAPEAERRLFVIGGMEELGAEAEMFHRALGRSLRLRDGDVLCAIGDQAEAVTRGAIEGGAKAERVSAAKDVREIAAVVAEWNGAVFVKGSRRWALERIWEDEEAHA